MEKIPDLEEYEIINEWIEDVVSNTGISEDILWAIVEQFRPGASKLTGSEKEKHFKRTLKHLWEEHKRKSKEQETPVGDWLDLYFHFQGTTNNHFQVGWGHWNLSPIDEETLNDEIKDRVIGIAERFEAGYQFNTHHTAIEKYDIDLEEAFRLTNEVLRAIYNTTFDELERVVFVEGETGAETPWTDI